MVDLMIVSSGPAADSLSPIDPTTDITIAPSEWVAMDICYTAESTWMLTSLSIDIVVDGAATLDMSSLTEPTGAWDPLATLMIENEPGKNYTLQYAIAPNGGVAGAGETVPVMALDHILLHCDGQGQVAVTMTDTTATFETDWMTGVFSPAFGGPVSITQVPEPMTVALLGLGSLFLLRRRFK